MWVTVHNKKTFKNITCPNSVVFPLKEKNMALQSLWWIPCFHSSLVLYKIVHGEAALLRSCLMWKFIEAYREGREIGQTKRELLSRRELRSWAGKGTRSVLWGTFQKCCFCFYFSSNTEPCGSRMSRAQKSTRLWGRVLQSRPASVDMPNSQKWNAYWFLSPNDPSLWIFSWRKATWWMFLATLHTSSVRAKETFSGEQSHLSSLLWRQITKRLEN